MDVKLQMTTNEKQTQNEKSIKLPNELMTKIEKLPDIVTPKHLAELFDVDQKLIRRHLRNKFSSIHPEPNTPWQFKKSGKTMMTVLVYFNELKSKNNNAVIE